MSLIQFLEAHWAEIVALCTGAAALATTIVNLAKTSKLSKALEAAKRRQTMVVCPHCKKESPLSEVKFVLPTGELDNNLNGVPDREE